MVRAFTNSWGRGGDSLNLMLSLNLLKSKIPISGGVGGAGVGGFVEFDVEFKFAKIQNSHLWGDRGCGGVYGKSWNLMLSLNLLKSKIPICRDGGGRGWGGSRNLMLSSNLLKSKIPICGGAGGGGSQNLMLSSNLLKSKIPISAGLGGWGGSQNLMLSSNLLKSKIPICGGMGGVGGVQEIMEFDVEFKFAKIQNTHL